MRRLALILMLLVMPLASKAQQTATLVADRVLLTRANTLEATGNIEILFGTTRLRASRVVYSRAGDSLTIEGPITLVEADGAVIVVADQAQLDADLQNGILTSARLVLDQQLQLAANEIARIDGRYTRLSQTVASSCEVCADNPVPVWEIRAREIIHDQQERQLYFDQAQFRFLGVPIFYAPRMRLPDPTLSRASGFLLPSLRTSSTLKTGVKLPYFLKLGDHADLTLTPYVSSATTTLEAEYRQAFSSGDLSFEGALTNDDLLPGSGRYYLFGTGSFALPRKFRLDFDVELVSDTDYLLDYGYSDKDRLDSEVSISRARSRDLFRASVTDFRTLREAEIPIRDELPRTYTQVNYERRIAAMGGELRLGLDAASLTRSSNALGLGRDVSRLLLSAEYRHSYDFANGMIATGTLGITGSTYDTRQDRNFATNTGQVTPSASLELRWPFQRSETGGAYQLLQPIVQLVWAETRGDAVPNEDSTLIEFDEGNLFSLSRFPGEDAFEQGARANIGVSWNRYDPDGWVIGVTVGRILRAEDTGQFSAASGLSGEKSFWLAAAQVQLGDRLSVIQRALFDDDFTFARNEMRLAWQNDRAAVGSSYLWMIADASENRIIDTHELSVDAAYRLSRHWTGRVDGRFDLIEDRAAEAGLGLEYRSECLTVDLSVSRRFAYSTNVTESTDFGLNVTLAGFGSGRNNESYRRVCAQ